jgi:hypothetical protein
MRGGEGHPEAFIGKFHKAHIPQDLSNLAQSSIQFTHGMYVRFIRLGERTQHNSDKVSVYDILEYHTIETQTRDDGAVDLSTYTGTINSSNTYTHLFIDYKQTGDLWVEPKRGFINISPNDKYNMVIYLTSSGH